MTDDPSWSNPFFSEDSTLEDSMCNILSFKIVHLKKGLILVWPLGGLFLSFQKRILEIGLSLLVLHFCLEKSFVGTLRQLILTFSSLEIPCKNQPPNIKIIAEAKRI